MRKISSTLKKLALALGALLILAAPLAVNAARTDSLFDYPNGATYYKPNGSPNGADLFLFGINHYISFGALFGVNGYGIRDNAGVMEFKNSGGAWTSFGSGGGGSGTVTSVDASGGTTGLSFTGGPVTTSGVLTLSGTLGAVNGGTGSTTLSGILVGNGTSAIQSLMIGSGLSFTGGTLSATNSGTVTSVTATYPILSSGGATPNISTAFGTTTPNVFSAPQTFNAGATTTSLSIGSLSGFLKATAGVVSTALVNLTSDVTGILPIANGGTATSTAPAYGKVLVGNLAGTGYDQVSTSTFGGGGTNYLTLTGSSLQNNVGTALGINVAPNSAALEVMGTTSNSTAAGLAVWNSAASSTLYVRNDGNVGFGTNVPDSPVTINMNTSGAPPALGVFTGTTLHTIGTDGLANRVVQDSFGGATVYSLRRADGTNASPTAVGANENVFTFGGAVYTGSGYTSTKAQFNMVTTQVQTPTANGMGFNFLTTPNNSTTLAEAMRIDSSGYIGIGTTTPAWKLDVASSSASVNTGIGFGQLALTDSGAGANLKHWLFSSENGNLYVGTTTDAFATSTVPAFTIANLGNVGIATSSPYAALSLGGGNLVLGAITAGGTPGDLFLPKLGTAAGSFLAVDGTGKVIATTSPSGGGAVSSVSNADGTLTISPTTGAVVASLNLANSNTWSVTQTFTPQISINGLNTGKGAGGRGNDTAFGVGSLPSDSTGNDNTAIGFNTLISLTSSSQDTAIGDRALRLVTGGLNTAVGSAALNNLGTGIGNTVVGANAMSSASGATFGNVAIGTGAGNSGAGVYSGNTYVGYEAAENAAGLQSSTTVMGYESGFNLGTASQDTFFGGLSGQNVTTGSNNIAIGYNALIQSATANNQLNIGNILFGVSLPAANNTATSLLVPTTGLIGIGTTSPYAKLSIHANNGDTATTLFAIASSTASATTTLFFIDNTGHVVTGSPKGSLSTCGTTNTLNGNDTSGTIMLTGTLVTACTLNLATPVPTSQNLSCTVSDASTAIFSGVTATTTSSVTFGLSGTVSTATIFYHCDRNLNN